MKPNRPTTTATAAQAQVAFLTLFDAVAQTGWQPLLDDLQEVALVRNDETLAHGFRLLSAVAEDPDDDPEPPASSAHISSPDDGFG
jgi:hypothetical protein